MRILFLLFSFFIYNYQVSGQDIYIPEKNDHNAEKYDYYVDLLKGSFTEGHYWYGFHNTYIAYYHLKAPVDTVFEYINKAIVYDPIIECDMLFSSKFNFAKIAGRGYFPDKLKALKYVCDSIYASLDSTLIDILTIMHENDQKYRADSKYAPWIAGNEKYWEEQAILDDTNQRLIEKIIARHGYPGRRKVGMNHEEIAFMVIQHGDLKLQEKYVGLIKQAVDKGQLSRKYYPLLIDRIRMRQDLPQVYGTQLVHNKKNDRLELYEMESLENIDELRAKYGLSTLRDYLKETGAHMPQKD